MRSRLQLRNLVAQTPRLCLRTSHGQPRHTIRASAALALAASIALAQERLGQPRPFGQSNPPMRVMDAGVNDVSALAASTRLIPVDLRAPMDFDRVFQVTGPGGRLETRPATLDSPTSSGVFARVSGGLSYVFPRSTYIQTRLGDLPTLPPGGHYQLGLPGQESIGRPGGPVGPMSRAVSAQAAMPVAATPVLTTTRFMTGSLEPSASSESQTAPPERPPPKSLWLDEAYRRTRVSALLDQAFSAR